jgi:hypothetical protein
MHTLLPRQFGQMHQPKTTLVRVFDQYRSVSPQQVATLGEHPDFKIPYLGFRGSPTGIDVRRVVATGVVPVIDGGLAGKDGGQIGAGVLKAPLACFIDAARALGPAAG